MVYFSTCFVSLSFGSSNVSCPWELVIIGLGALVNGQKVAKLNVITGFDSIQKGYPFTMCGVQTYQDLCLQKIEVSLYGN